MESNRENSLNRPRSCALPTPEWPDPKKSHPTNT